MCQKELDEFGHGGLERREECLIGWRQAHPRVERFPELLHRAPLWMRIERPPDRAAQLDADPRDRMRVLWVQPEDEDPWQAHDADQAHRRGHTDSRHRPEVGEDLGDPPLPVPPGLLLLAFFPLTTRPENGAKRFDDAEKRGRLMPDLVDER